MAVGMRPNPSPTLDDAAALEAASLFERHSARIHAYCLHFLRDRGEAEDALQTTFLNAHRALQRGVRPEHEYAWLHTIAKNACRTLQRTKGRRAPVAHDVDVDTIPGHGAEGDTEELRAQLAGALAELPERQRRALVLREWHGLTPDEIAARLGLSVSATHALLTRARRSLASALTTAARGPLSALNLGALGDLLRAHAKSLLGGAASKTAIATVAAASVGVGGIVVGRSLDDGPRHPATSPVRGVQPSVVAATPVAAQSTTRGDAGPRSSTPAARASVATAPRRAFPPPGSPVPVPEQAPQSSPALEPAQHATPLEGSDASVPPTLEVGSPPLPSLPGVPPLLPELVPQDPLPPIEVPPLPQVEVPPLPPTPELPLDVDVQPPQLPLP